MRGPRAVFDDTRKVTLYLILVYAKFKYMYFIFSARVREHARFASASFLHIDMRHTQGLKVYVKFMSD